ncbi:hypothetical protein J7K27_06280 [Candidatus Bathyarchaeota archaeon]|nr:hypothetical protein [Candidatus Bathyarchaeota archaeon]
MGEIEILLNILERANYRLERVEEIVNSKVQECEKRIKEIESMSQTEFLRMVSRSIFGVACKGYYIHGLKKSIETLKRIPERIQYLLKLHEKDKEMFEWVLKHSYKRYVRKLRKAIKKLAENSLNHKLTTFA